MVFLIKTIYESVNNFIEKNQDDRLNDRFMMGTFWKPFTLTILYVYFVQNLGPKLMKNRKPFELKKIILAYNLIQVFLNAYMAIRLTIILYNNKDPITCLSLSQNSEEENHVVHLYYMIKISDLLDTVFFVLRKKYNQVSFLHVYHHSLMIIGTYMFAQYYPGGHFMYVGLFNSYVHMFMYFYYLITLLKPEFKNNIKWKKRLTKLQITQFSLLFIHFFNPFIFGNSCNAPVYLLKFCLVENLCMTLMFADFYYKTYIKKRN